MNVSDIISKQFSRVFKGYDIQEVDTFLDEVIRDYETYEDNYKLMVLRIHALLDEVEKLEKLIETQNIRL